jgi:peptide-methionine (S)-S-oxide reductase
MFKNITADKVENMARPTYIKPALGWSRCIFLALLTATTSNAEPTQQTAVFAGGCFWGVDAVFRHVKGVSDVVSGYTGGNADTANYKQVSKGNTGHVESVRVRFDPALVSYQQLLQVFFKVVHDPTKLNRQGPDNGGQYRSVIFYTTAEQHEISKDYIRELNGKHIFLKAIVTLVVPLHQFYPAEDFQQNYYALHRYMGYIVANDVPKLNRLRKQFPALYR